MRAKEFIQLNELNMAPGVLSKFAASPAATNMMAGFEAELIFPGDYDPDNQSPDYSNDSTIPHNCNIDDVRTFFEIGRFDQGATSGITDDYDEYVNEEYATYSEKNIDTWIRQVHDDIEEEGTEDDFDRDEIRDRAFDEMQDYYYQHDTPSMNDFFRTTCGNSWSDIAGHYDLTWPAFKNDDFEIACNELANTFKQAIGVTPKVSHDTHSVPRTATAWIFEPDSSITPAESDTQFGLEIISPPMPILQMLDKLQATIKWAITNGGETNSSTGLHVGVSIKGVPGVAIDYVKLALFLGDEYVLDQFRRSANIYTKSAVGLVQRSLITNDVNIPQQLANLKKGLLTSASRNILSMNSDKYVSINVHGNYIEFRSMGGNYLHGEFSQIKNTVLRYVQAYAVAADPNAHKREYAKKLHKMLNPGGSDQLAPYVDYVMGTIDKDELIATATDQRTARLNATGKVAQQAQDDDKLLAQLSTNSNDPAAGLRDNSRNGEF